MKKHIFTLRPYPSKHFPIIAECIPLRYSNVYASVTEALGHLAGRYGNTIIIRNITGKEA